MRNYITGILLEDSPPRKNSRLVTHDGNEEIVCHNLVEFLPMTLDAGLGVVAFEDEKAGQWEIIQAECPE